MAASRLSVALIAGFLGAVSGFVASRLLEAAPIDRSGGSAHAASDGPTTSTPLALRTSSEGGKRIARDPKDPRKRAGQEPTPASDDRESRARSAELREARSRESDARHQLSVARKRIAELERELGEPPPRHAFDFTSADWKTMASTGNMKYRVPCGGGAQSAPAAQVLDELGLAPDDGEAIRRAYENSADRLYTALLPLCARALDNRMDLAQAISTDSCRHILLSTATTRSEDAASSTRRVASYMAGEGPRPSNASLTDLTLLALAEEAKRFEDDLAQAFGPEEAHRLVFSDRLCFTAATHRFGKPFAPSP